MASPFRVSRGHVDHASPLDLAPIRRSVAGMYIAPVFVPELLLEVERLRAALARRTQRARLESIVAGAFIALLVAGLLYASCSLQIEEMP